MAWFTRFPCKVLKFTPARLVDLCRLKSMTEIFDFAITTSKGTVDKNHTSMDAEDRQDSLAGGPRERVPRRERLVEMHQLQLWNSNH